MSDLSQIKSILTKQDKKLDEIHFAIFGNKEAGVKGIAEIQKDQYKTIKEYNRTKWIAVGAVVGGWGGFIAYIKTHLGI